MEEFCVHYKRAFFRSSCLERAKLPQSIVYGQRYHFRRYRQRYGRRRQRAVQGWNLGGDDRFGHDELVAGIKREGKKFSLYRKTVRHVRFVLGTTVAITTRD